MADKLTHALTVKLSEDMHQTVVALAAIAGFESPSEYVRHLISLDVEARRAQHRALCNVFGITALGAEGNVGGRGLPDQGAGK